MARDFIDRNVLEMEQEQKEAVILAVEDVEEAVVQACELGEELRHVTGVWYSVGTRPDSPQKREQLRQMEQNVAASFDRFETQVTALRVELERLGVLSKDSR